MAIQVETRTKIMGKLAGASTPSPAAHLCPPYVCMGYRSLAALGCALCSKKSPSVRRNPSFKDLGIWWGQLQSLSCVPVGRAHAASQLQIFGEAGRSQPRHRRGRGREGPCPALGSPGAHCVNFSGHSQQVPSRNASYISLKCLCICFPWPETGSCRVPG